MRGLILFSIVLLIYATVRGREYHYDRPQQPFHRGPAQQGHSLPITPATTSSVIQTYGTSGRVYDLQTVKSRTLYEGKQLPQLFGQGSVFGPVGPGGGAAPAHNYQQSLPTHLTAPIQQQYTHNYNPLLQGHPNSVNYNGGHFHQGGVRQGHAHGAAQLSQPIAAPHGNGAIVPVQGGGYISQSQASQLDVYPPSQVNGNKRDFTRQVISCEPNGQCTRLTLGPGQIDPHHQHILHHSHAQVQPVSDKCRQKRREEAIKAASEQAYAGGSYYRKPVVTPPPEPVRPKDRRLVPYTEVPRPQDPYN